MPASTAPAWRIQGAAQGDPKVDARDQRQVLAMLARIEAYENGQIGLGTLVSDLGFLLDAMEDVDSAWRNALSESIGDLEQAYAVALDRGMRTLDEAAERTVRTALSGMKELLRTRGDSDGKATQIMGYPRVSQNATSLTVEFAPGARGIKRGVLRMVLDCGLCGEVLGIEIISLLGQAGKSALGAIRRSVPTAGEGVTYSYDEECDCFYLSLSPGRSVKQRTVDGSACYDAEGQITALTV
jgi:hypothetical protein